MGVEDFSTFLEKYAPNSYFKVPLTSFSGKRIAVDLDNLIHIMTPIAAGQILDQTNLIDTEPDHSEIHRIIINRVLERLETFMFYNIQVICCFDSKPHPLKARVKEERNKKKKKATVEYEAAKAALYGVPPLFRNAQLVGTYAKAFKYAFKPSFEFTAHVRNLLSTLGFPVLVAGDYLANTGDGEGLAASLCVSGNDFCVATSSTDSDIHAYGGNLAILELSSERHQVNGVSTTIHFAKVRSLEAILQQLQWSFNTFFDMCILLGTDFNLRIPGIGPVKGFDLIKRYGSILSLGSSRDISVLNYLEVISVFQSSMIKLNPKQVDFDVNRFNQNARGVLEIESLSSHINTLRKLPVLQSGSGDQVVVDISNLTGTSESDSQIPVPGMVIEF